MSNTLKLYNTLTRSKEVFEPLDPSNVRMYVCGPTVYDNAHIGNARPVIVFDVLFRLLRHIYGKDHVTYARNITDVDDKINARAVRDFPGLPLNEAINRVTKGTDAQFQADVNALGCLQPTSQPRATAHIDDMVKVINALLEREHAYIAEGTEGFEVLFEVDSMPRYGMLSGRRLDEQKVGARVAVEAHKKNPADFVLWKQSGQREPGWNGDFVPEPQQGFEAEFTMSDRDRRTFGHNSRKKTIYGRPGWHIECSAMSMAKLLEPFGGGLQCDDPVKNTFDIHGGGLDLIFPHHENEIAQSCCAFGSEKMASIWMHNGFLQVEGQKMSKSLGNFITIDDLLNTTKFGGRSWPGGVLRLAMLKTHYRQPIDWTVKALEEAVREIELWARLLMGTAGQVSRIKKNAGCVAPEVSGGLLAALSDDLNTPAALSVVREYFGQLRAGDEGASFALAESITFLGLADVSKLPLYTDVFISSGAAMAPPEAIPLIREFKTAILNNNAVRISEVNAALAALGVTATVQDETGNVVIESASGADIKTLIDTRNAARAAKDFAESDRLRGELEAMGLQIKDGKDADGNPVTTWEVKR